MKTGSFLAGCVSMALVALPVQAGIEQCEGGIAEIYGSVTTVNSPDGGTQSGDVHFKAVNSKNGHVIFDEEGSIEGTVVESIGGFPTKLNHVMQFENGVRLDTYNDTVIDASPADLNGDGIPDGIDFNGDGIPDFICAYNITELVSDANGTRKLARFSNADHEIIATGTVSFCPWNNQNNFVLSGYACIE